MTQKDEPMTETTETEAVARKSGPPLAVRLWPLYVIAGGLAFAYSQGWHRFLSLDTLREQREVLNAFVAEQPLTAVAIYLGVYALSTVFMLPGALWITIAGGFLFGLAGGSAATVVGATMGASILFFAARSAIGQPLRERAGPWLSKMEAGFKEDSLSYMFALRFIPAVPFPVANIAPAILGARYSQYALTTALGIIPGVVAYTWIGAGLGATFDAGEDPNLAAVAANLIPALIALGAVALLPVIYKKVFAKKTTKLEGAA